MRQALTYSIAGLTLALCASVSMAVTLDRYDTQMRSAIRGMASYQTLGAEAQQRILGEIDRASAFAGVVFDRDSATLHLALSAPAAIDARVLEDQRQCEFILDQTVALFDAIADDGLESAGISAAHFSQSSLQPELQVRLLLEFNTQVALSASDSEWQVTDLQSGDTLLRVGVVEASPVGSASPAIENLRTLLSSAHNGENTSERMRTLEAQLSGQLPQPVAASMPDVRLVTPFSLKVDALETVLQGFQTDEPAPAEEPAVEEAAPAPEEPVIEEPTPPAPREVAPQLPDTGETNKQVAQQRQELLEQLETGEKDMKALGITSAADDITAAPKRQIAGNPMDQIVTIDFREMPLTNAVAILAHKGDINVIAGSDLEGLVVTTQLKNVPLRQAMATALRIHKLGLVEEEGIFYIRPYEEAVAADRYTTLVQLDHAKPEDIKKVLDEMSKGVNFEDMVSISAHEEGDIIVLAGPQAKVNDLAAIVKSLDVERRSLPTVTEAVQLNFATPDSILTSVSSLSTPEVGQVTADVRSRSLVITDIPVVVEQIKVLVKELDRPVRQVAIDSMIVDAVLGDDAETGVDWLMQAVKRQSRRDAALGNGTQVGNLQNLGLNSQLGIADTAAGILDFGILTGDLDWSGIIQAEVRNNDSRLISNPRMVTLENEEARLAIAQEIPYVELTSTEAGGQQTSTEFKDIGTQLTVTPRVTNDNQILVKVEAKESFANGVFNGIPVEDKREVSTNALMKNGETMWLGGLRKNSNTASVRKIPILGDIPVMNVLFRQNTRSEDANELLIFLTCTVVEAQDYLNEREKKLGEESNLDAGPLVDAQRSLFVDMAHPDDMRDPIWRWRRSEQ